MTEKSRWGATQRKQLNKNRIIYGLYYCQPVIVTECQCLHVYKWCCSQPHRQRGQRFRDSSTLCRTFSLACWYPLLLSPRQHGRGQYSSEHRHYSGQWLGRICHEYKENHFQEQPLQRQPRIGTRYRTFSMITAAAEHHKSFKTLLNQSQATVIPLNKGQLVQNMPTVG